MSFLDKFRKKNVPQNNATTQVEVSDQREEVPVGQGLVNTTMSNDESTVIIVRAGYQMGKQPKFATLVPPETFESFVAKDGVYSDATITGYVKIEEYSEGGQKHIKMLSYNPQSAINIGVPASVRIPGYVINGTINMDLMLHGDAKAISWYLNQSLMKKVTDGKGFVQEYLTAKDLKNIVEQGVVDEAKVPLYRDEVYRNSDEIREAIREKIKNSMFFMDRALEPREVFIRFEETELEKIKDEAVRIRFMTKEQQLKLETKRAGVKSAFEDNAVVKTAEKTEKADAEAEASEPAEKKPEEL